MSTVTVREGTPVVKDPADIKVYVFDWDTLNLAAGVAISTSTFTITYVTSYDAAGNPLPNTIPLTKDQESILAGSRKTQVRLSAGTLGLKYRIDNRIVTNESPSQTKDRSFSVLVQNK